MRLKASPVILLIVSLVNLLVFFFRDHFQYQPYSGHTELYGPCNEQCRFKWTRFLGDYPAEELGTAKKIADSVTRHTRTGHEKILALGSFLHGRFHTRLGRPADAVLQATPLGQYQQLSASDSLQLWCGNYAMMFAYFCWTQGIPCRILEIMKPGDRHVVNECYLGPGQWMLVDLTNNILAARDSIGRFLNFIEVRSGSGNTISISRALGDSVGSLPVSDARRVLPDHYGSTYPVHYYHTTNNKKVYSTGEKLKRYFLADRWYDIYDDNGGSNFLFRLRQALLLLWAVSFFVFLYNRAKFRA